MAQPSRSASEHGGAAKTRKPRSPSAPKAAYFIVQVLDENGQPMLFDKNRVKIISVERNADKVLEMVEGNKHPFAFYLRGVVPAPGSAPETNSQPTLVNAA